MWPLQCTQEMPSPLEDTHEVFGGKVTRWLQLALSYSGKVGIPEAVKVVIIVIEPG